MKRSTIAKFAAAGVIGAFFVGNPLPASAAAPEVFHERFSEVEENIDVCGINMDFAVEGAFTGHVFFDADGNFDHFVGTASGTQTLTNDAGESLVIRFADVSIETESVDEEAGTVTFFATIKGLPELIKAPHGSVLARDAGIIGFADTFDLETGEFRSTEILVNKGHHPEADSDFALFCEVVSAELG